MFGFLAASGKNRTTFFSRQAAMKDLNIYIYI